MRYLIKYTKESNIKFIAHLDLMRTIQKIIRRAELPVKYSNGFNPHMSLSIAQPLSVGVYSNGEYLDLILVEEVNEEEIINRLNEKTASGIRFLEAKKIVEKENVKKLPQAMALIDACRYTVKIAYKNIDNVLKEMDDLTTNQKEWKIIKETKTSTKEVDIKPMIFEIKYWIKDNSLVLNLLLRSGSREHLSADLVVKYIKMHTTNVKDAFVDIRREEMYFYKQEKLEPLYNCR